MAYTNSAAANTPVRAVDFIETQTAANVDRAARALSAVGNLTLGTKPLATDIVDLRNRTANLVKYGASSVYPWQDATISSGTIAIKARHLLEVRECLYDAEYNARCGDNCYSICSSNCGTICTGCIGTCVGACGNGCKGCYGTCRGSVFNDCGCANICSSACADNCSGGCNNGCNNLCKTMCSTTCSNTCYNACNTGCLSGCTGQYRLSTDPGSL